MGSCPTLPPCRSTPGTAGMLSPEFLIFAQYNSQTLVIQTPTPKLQFVLLQFIKHYCKIVLQCVEDFCRLMKLYLRLLLRNSASLIVHWLSLNTWYVLLWIKCSSFIFFAQHPNFSGSWCCAENNDSDCEILAEADKSHKSDTCTADVIIIIKKKPETNPNLKYLLYKLKLKNLFFKSSFI